MMECLSGSILHKAKGQVLEHDGGLVGLEWKENDSAQHKTNQKSETDDWIREDRQNLSDVGQTLADKADDMELEDCGGMRRAPR